MEDTITAQNLAANVRALREARGVSQQQIAQIAGIPRPTWANIESGVANPTLAVLTRVAAALGAHIEQLLINPRSSTKHWAAESLPVERQGRVTMRTLIDQPGSGLVMRRTVLQPGGSSVVPPHAPQTYAYLTCEVGELNVDLSHSQHVLAAGDLLTFRADQSHTYRNPTRLRVVAYYVVSHVRPPD